LTGSRHDGRLAVVTGSARGIGRAYAERLAIDGARLVLADLEPATETEAAIVAAGGEVTGARCDVSDPGGVDELAARCAELGGADILVHNAGIYPMRPYTEIDLAEWRHVMSVNLDSIFLVSKALLPQMIEKRWGRLIGISSGMFHAGSPGSLHYVTSKGGIIGFVRALAAEVGEAGVTVNAIAPGLIRSPGTSTGLHDELGLFDMVIASQAIKREGSPADLTGAVSYLASEEASFVTGQTWLIDGGVLRA
jgi:NAD(P)-dependent dehydrogenase (short-subunit alcohol dehydrogenase family)